MGRFDSKLRVLSPGLALVLMGAMPTAQDALPASSLIWLGQRAKGGLLGLELGLTRHLGSQARKVFTSPPGLPPDLKTTPEDPLYQRAEQELLQLTMVWLELEVLEPEFFAWWMGETDLLPSLSGEGELYVFSPKELQAERRRLEERGHPRAHRISPEEVAQSLKVHRMRGRVQARRTLLRGAPDPERLREAVLRAWILPLLSRNPGPDSDPPSEAPE